MRFVLTRASSNKVEDIELETLEDLLRFMDKERHQVVLGWHVPYGDRGPIGESRVPRLLIYDDWLE